MSSVSNGFESEFVLVRWGRELFVGAVVRLPAVRVGTGGQSRPAGGRP